MAFRPQQYRLTWPLTPAQVENIDSMIETLFRMVKKLSGATGATGTTGAAGASSSDNTGSGAAALSLLTGDAGSTENTDWSAPIPRPVPVYQGGTGLSGAVLGDVLYGSDTGVLAALPGNTTSTQKFLAQTGDGALSAAPSWQLPSTAGSLIFFFYKTASDIATYFVMKTPASVGAAQTFAIAAVGNGTTTLESFATLVGVPNVTFVPAGICTCYITARASAAGAQISKLFAEFYQRTSGGVETLLATSAQTIQLTTSDVAYTFQGAIPSSTVFVSSDRLVTKVRAFRSGGGTLTLTLTVEGLTAARSESPSAAIDATNFVPYSGATANVDLGSNTLTTTGNMSAATQAVGDASVKVATTAFVTTAINNAIAGVNPAVAVKAATIAILQDTPVYFNGVSGIGATITAGVTNTTLVIDSYTPVVNDRVLVKNESGGGGLGAAKNGVYLVTAVGSLGVAWALTRALDYDMPSDINSTGAIPVTAGTVNLNTTWVITSQVTTVGTDALTYVQFSVNPTTVLTTASVVPVGNLPPPVLPMSTDDEPERIWFGPTAGVASTSGGIAINVVATRVVLGI